MSLNFDHKHYVPLGVGCPHLCHAFDDGDFVAAFTSRCFLSVDCFLLKRIDQAA